MTTRIVLPQEASGKDRPSRSHYHPVTLHYLPIAQAAERLGMKRKRRGPGYVGKCSVHGGDNPRAATLIETRDGRLYYHCHTAGCSWSAIKAHLMSLGIITTERSEQPDKNYINPHRLEHAQWMLLVAASDLRAGKDIPVREQPGVRRAMRDVMEHKEGTLLGQHADRAVRRIQISTDDRMAAATLVAGIRRLRADKPIDDDDAADLVVALRRVK